MTAALLAAVALALWLPTHALPATTPPHAAMKGALAAAGVVALVLWLPADWLVPALLAAAAAIGGRELWSRRTARAAADARSLRVLETCEQLAAELTAGQPPGAALVRAAEDWPDLAPVAAAHAVGADVPDALRALATTPGAEDLRLLGAAWQVAHRTGQGLAGAVDRVARDLVAARSTRCVVDGELASARSTARLVAVLPVAALAMGSGVGGDPLDFLLHSPAGWACLAAGLAFGLAGLAWIEALARDVDRLG
jgi:tight adherence protein B